LFEKGGDTKLATWRATPHVHILALALVLSRLMTLHHCLDISEREGVEFTCKRWMLLQLSFQSMVNFDVFASLFQEIAHLVHGHKIDLDFITKLVHGRFFELRRRLLDHTPNTPFND